jgi:hypothetical protein
MMVGESRRGIGKRRLHRRKRLGDFGQAPPAHYCGQAYSGDNKFRFVASYEMMEVDTDTTAPKRAESS